MWSDGLVLDGGQPAEGVLPTAAVVRPLDQVTLDAYLLAGGPSAAVQHVLRLARPFHGVDLDGDGVPDERQAVMAVKGPYRSMKLPCRSRGEADDVDRAEPGDQWVSDSDG